MLPLPLSDVIRERSSAHVRKRGRPPLSIHQPCSLGTRLSLRGRRVWPTAHTRLVLASHNYSGKLSGCRPQCFHWRHTSRPRYYAKLCYARSLYTLAVCTVPPDTYVKTWYRSRTLHWRLLPLYTRRMQHIVGRA